MVESSSRGADRASWRVTSVHERSQCVSREVFRTHQRSMVFWETPKRPSQTRDADGREAIGAARSIADLSAPVASQTDDALRTATRTGVSLARRHLDRVGQSRDGHWCGASGDHRAVADLAMVVVSSMPAKRRGGDHGRPGPGHDARFGRAELDPVADRPPVDPRAPAAANQSQHGRQRCWQRAPRPEVLSAGNHASHAVIPARGRWRPACSNRFRHGWRWLTLV